MFPAAQHSSVNALGNGLGSRPMPDLYIWIGVRRAVLAIVAVRAICDPIFQQSEFELAGSPIGFGAVLNASVIAIALMLLVSRPAYLQSAINLIWIPFLLVAFISIFSSPQFVSAMRLFLVILSYWAFFIIPLYILRKKDDLGLFISIVFISSLIPIVYGLYEFAYEYSQGDAFRIKSTFTHANIFAFYLVLLIGLVLFVQESRGLHWSKRSRRLFLLFLPALVLLLIMTKTRSAWLAGSFVFLAYATLIDRRFLLFVLLMPILFLFDSTVSDRLLDLQKGTDIEDLNELNAEVRLNSFAWREVLWFSAVPRMLAEPIWGYGLESFRYYSPEFFPLTMDEEGIDAHSLYVQVQFELGLLGIVGFVFLMGGIAVHLTNGMRHGRNGMVVLCGLLMVYLVVSYSDNMLYYLAFNWYFFFVMGTACAWSRLQRTAHQFNAIRSIRKARR